MQNPVISSGQITVELGTPEKNNLPLAVQSLVTQTDRSGNQVALARPTYDIEEEKEPANRPFFQRLFSCCIHKQPKEKLTQPTSSTASSRSASTSPHVNTITKDQRTIHQYPSNGIVRGRPAKMPDCSEILPRNIGKKCLALDLDETLVHSSFTPVAQAHFVIPVTIEGIVHNVFVTKRPGVDEFMRRVGEHFEVIIYTASLSKYADPLLDKLDIHRVISKRLFREHCVFHEGHYVKDLALLNRPLNQTIIVDNSPMSYIFHPENAIDCGSFIDDPSDVEMWQIADFLVGIKDCDDVSLFCRHWRDWCRNNPTSVPP